MPLLNITLFGSISFMILEIIQMRAGLMKYLKDGTNFFDYTQIVIFSLYYKYKKLDFQNAVSIQLDEQLSIENEKNEWDLKILVVIHLFTMLAKIMNMLKVSKKFGIMTMMIAKAFKEAIPVISIFILMTIFFGF